MSALPIWNCEFKAQEGAAPLDNLTVGSLFRLHCQGEIEVEWKEGPFAVVFPDKNANYSLVVLKADKTNAKEAEFVVTGYKAGSHVPEYVRIIQGEAGFEMLKPKWEIKSVLKPNQMNEPYPPFGPWSLAMPIWVLFVLGLAAALVFYFGFRVFRRSRQRAKMLAELTRHQTALSPLHQFYRDARQLRRRLHNVKQAEELSALSKDLDREFRLYVLRQFQIPTLDWTDGEIVRDFKRRHRKVYEKAGDPLRKTLRELTRLVNQKEILFKDVEQIQRMSLETVETIDSAMTGAKR